MTESKWLDSTDPDAMMRHLRGKMSDRKLRLFAVACCRGVWHLLEHVGQQAVAAAESFADGLETREGLKTSRLAANAEKMIVARNAARDIASTAAKSTSWEARALAADAAWIAAGRPKALRVRDIAWESESRLQSDLLRCIVGNPFGLRPKIGRISTTMALAIYESRDFARMFALGKALRKAGCSDKEVLRHCEQEGPHCRGCHVVDLLLGKQ